jgi:hypothetical protein
MKTMSEIEDLKSQWESDPCWDLEDTDGFEDYEDELLAYRKQKEIEWKQKAKQKVRDKAAELGCPENLKLAEYVMSLEWRLEKLEGRSE